MGSFVSLLLAAWILCNLRQAVGTRSLHSKKIHHHMTQDEVRYFFGVDNHHEVPDYDVSIPYHSNENGELLSYHGKELQSRGNDGPENLFYKVPLFGRELHLKLTPNRDFMSQNLKMRTIHSDGTVTLSPIPKNNHYSGYELSDPGSVVAISVARGLTGMVKLSDGLYFIHSLPNHLAKRATPTLDTANGTPHIIYRHTKQADVDFYFRCPVKNEHAGGPTGPTNTSSGVKTLEGCLMIENETAQQLISNGNVTAHDYLLLLGMMIARFLSDPTIGPITIRYRLVRLEVIEKEVIGANYSDTKTEWLNKMLAYANKNNDPDDSNPEHYDGFSLIYEMKTNVGGLANFEGMCTPGNAGNVYKMRGLQSAFGIAHETGHNLGAEHDGQARQCPNGMYIMSSYLPGGSSAGTWSVCSAHAIQSFLGSNKSTCLDDVATSSIEAPLKYPVKRHLRKDIASVTKKYQARDEIELFNSSDSVLLNHPELQSSLPGQLASGDLQCKLQYGPKHFRCKGSLLSSCGKLWCTSDGLNCETVGAPPADGTACGERNWCIKGRCEDNGRPEINGKWSEWSAYTNCTRNCDGGVQHRQRTCTNPAPSNGGRRCPENSEGHWRICNIQPCNLTMEIQQTIVTYRDEQCKELSGPDYWAVYMKEPCDLYCRTGYLAERMGLVKDGTRCYENPDKHDVCILGKCREAGCDDVIGSGTRVDRCGKCGGIGNTCKWITGSYRKQVNETGTKNADLIIELDQGAVITVFTEQSASTNQIGVKFKYGDYVSNPNSGRNVTVTKEGATFKIYTSRDPFKDEVEIKGPSFKIIQVMYIHRSGPNPGINYKYLQLLSENLPVLKYKWQMGSWSECSVTCAVGIQTREVLCVVMEDSTPVADNACKNNKPVEERSCNTQPCPPEWFETKWSICSKSCGNGTRSRQVFCRQKVSSPSLYERLNSSECDANDKPEVTDLSKTCNVISCNPVWKVISDWTACSTPCGPGFRTREVECMFTKETGFEKPSPVSCRFSKKPKDKEQCNETRPCLTDEDYKCFPHSPCKNGAACFEDPPGYHCECPAGFKGKLCGAKINPCDLTPCVNNGTCIQDPSNAAMYKCKCRAPYGGKDCQEKIYPCDSSPCLSGSTCISDPHDPSNYICQCAEWLTGRNCEIRLTMCDLEPCENGGYCSERELPAPLYKCFCPEWFTGVNCSVQIFPCDSNPCVNGATCSNDEHDISEYHCDCAEGYFGKNCQVPSYIEIGCFNAPQSGMTQLLQDFSDVITVQNANRYIKECGELAFDKGYSHFGLGDNGKCKSSANADSTYYEKSSTTPDRCKGGFGNSSAFDMYTFEGEPKYLPQGCFKEQCSGKRLLTIKYSVYADESDHEAAIFYCAMLARSIGYEYFAVQNYVECWTDNNMAEVYDKYGKADSCIDGVGTELTNFVYRVQPWISPCTACESDPCQHNGFCVVNTTYPVLEYTCQCQKPFTGKNCEIHENPCDSAQCQNNATCRVNMTDPAEYHCKCAGEYAGKNCQVPSFSEIGCFTYSNLAMPDLLGNFKDQLGCYDAKQVIVKCGELAVERQYRYFSLGNNGECISGKNANNTYYIEGSIGQPKCENGIGSGGRMDVYTFEPTPKVVPYGCFLEKSGDRLLNINYGRRRAETDPHKVITECAYLARDMKYEWFAVQNSEECWTEKNMSEVYDNYGPSDNCVDGIGKEMSNFVYRVQPLYHFPTGCDDDPCQNSGFCVVNSEDPMKYTCECQAPYMGKNCQVSVLPCDSNPCLHGGNCTNDEKDFTAYYCNCSDEFSGTNCQVPFFWEIGCFKYLEQAMPVILGDFQGEVDWSDTSITIGKCSELAFDGQYLYFALANKNTCVSGKNASVTYYIGGSVGQSKCKDGVGQNEYMDVYTFEPAPKTVPMGCYMEKGGSSRLLTVKYGKRGAETDPLKIITECAYLARDKKYEWFAVQNSEECWTETNMSAVYDKYGPSDNCVDGIGVGLTNFVYRILPQLNHYPSGYGAEPSQGSPSDQPPVVIGLGCFMGNTGKPSLLQTKFASFSHLRDPLHPDATAMQCAYVARDLGIQHFAVQNQGECWTGDTIVYSYKTYEKAQDSECEDGIGTELTIYLYQLMYANDSFPNL